LPRVGSGQTVRKPNRFPASSQRNAHAEPTWHR
jgi:hypothetical protein